MRKRLKTQTLVSLSTLALLLLSLCLLQLNVSLAASRPGQSFLGVRWPADTASKRLLLMHILPGQALFAVFGSLLERRLELRRRLHL